MDDYLSGFQMKFANNHESPLIEIEEVSRASEVITVDVDATRTIKYASMQISGSDNFQGIRLYDEEMELIVDEDWRYWGTGSWSELVEIPADRQIIGFNANTEDFQRIMAFQLILGPIND